MIIRREQMQALGAYMRRSFQDRMVAHMRRRFSRGNDLPDGELQKQVCEIIETAEGYQVDSEEDVQRFLELVFGRWPEAQSDGEILEILNSNDSPAVKVAFVADALTRRAE